MTDSNDSAPIDEADLQRVIEDAEGGLEGDELTAPGEQLDDDQLPPSH
jgi:hypothetical protein